MELCYSLYNLHEYNYSGAELAFEGANSYWNGLGLADKPFEQEHLYQSYKLAIDLIVWHALLNNNSTNEFAAQYSPVIDSISRVMSVLQGWDGGVVTGFYFANGGLQIIRGNSSENGETTSLFVIASDTN